MISTYHYLPPYQISSQTDVFWHFMNNWLISVIYLNLASYYLHICSYQISSSMEHSICSYDSFHFLKISRIFTRAFRLKVSTQKIQICWFLSSFIDLPHLQNQLEYDIILNIKGYSPMQNQLEYDIILNIKGYSPNILLNKRNLFHLRLCVYISDI